MLSLLFCYCFWCYRCCYHSLLITTNNAYMHSFIERWHSQTSAPPFNIEWQWHCFYLRFTCNHYQHDHDSHTYVYMFSLCFIIPYVWCDMMWYVKRVREQRGNKRQNEKKANKKLKEKKKKQNTYTYITMLMILM